MTAAWIVLTFFAGCAAHDLLRKWHIEIIKRASRRIGWGYGYGAGWVDGEKGLEARNVAPRDGRTRENGRTEADHG